MNKVIVIDYGSQYNQLITRRIRQKNVFVEVVSPTAPIEFTKDLKAIILSGGPNSVYEEGVPRLSEAIINSGLPILGICYGMQLIAQYFGSRVEKGVVREYGKNEITLLKEDVLFKGLSKVQTVFMSHSDHVTDIIEPLELLSTSAYANAIIKHTSKPIYGLQFHPEVTHSVEGDKLIENFLFEVAKIQPDWNIEDFITNKVSEIKDVVKDEHVILGLSGGVDSTVCAALLHKAIGKQLVCIFVDTGLLRKHEAIEVLKNYEVFKDLNIIKVDAKEQFYQALKGVKDPEEKRKIIGRVFFEVFEQEKEKHNYASFLAQGTIYPDVIESLSTNGGKTTIKSHHNVGGLPKQSTFKILEPLRELFKDEVRKVGFELNLDETLVNRHPFPGPGLGVRILGEIDESRVKILQEADDVFITLLRKHQLYEKVSQAFCVLLPVKSVGVMGDNRTYENVLAIRSVDTTDFMTATFSRLPFDFLEEVATTIINKVEGINRVVYDITSKPPGTIEWE